ncbi:MAG: hypothetical protein CSB55_03945 [Candidatus Cloacimonadota bacterium]|nr:MAG: hypothetical protein CSB55_03945 [Candidatus Cloacimonadota bacterium]
MVKIKTAHVIHQLCRGGAETSLYDICRFFNFKDIEFTIIIFEKDSDFEDEFKKLKNIKIINLNAKSRYDPVIFFKLFNVFKAENFDIVHTHLPVAGIYSRIINLFFKKKLITTQHSVLYKTSVFHKIDRLTMRMFNYGTIANSIFTRKFLQKYNYIDQNKTELIYLGADFSKLDNPKTNKAMRKFIGINESDIVLGHIGSFKPQKGHKYLINAFMKIHEKYKNSKLVLVGKGKLADEIKALVKKNQLSNSVIFVGEKSNIKDYINMFDIFVFPSISESFGISVLEALYLEKPVAAFNIDAVSEIIENGKDGVLTDSKNTSAFADAVINLLNNANLREKIISNAKNKAKKFEIDLCCEKLEEYYKKIYYEG